MLPATLAVSLVISASLVTLSSLKAVFDELDPTVGLYEFRKKGTTSKNLASYLPKHLRELLKN